MILSCHQPNFMPWPKFFMKMKAADVFILLEHVQYARHQYQNRFMFNDKWLTMKVNKGNLSDLIIDKKYICASQDWNNIKSRVNFEWLNEYDGLISESLTQTNKNLIRNLAFIQKIPTGLYSDFKVDFQDPNQKLIDLCKFYGAKKYLSGPSGLKYLNEDKFKKHGITIEYFELNDPAFSTDILNFMNASFYSK